MPAFHLLRCMVALGGDKDNVVYRDRSRPIVFPELSILMTLHGDDAVSDVHVVGTWEATNEEVLQRIRLIYGEEAVAAAYHGPRPRLPLSDASIPFCTLPVYKPRPVVPENPDPKLRPLDQFTIPADAPVGPVLPAEDQPTADEIAAHAQDDEDDLGLSQPPLVPALPVNPSDLPHMVHDPGRRGSSREARAGRGPNLLPDVNAGGSHSPTFEPRGPN